MANVKTETKAVATKEVKKVAPKAKEAKTMTAKEIKKVAEKIVEKKNEEKVNLLSIEEVTKMYSEVGISCKNPNAKGNYRIMKGGSSLNIKPTKGYYIYSNNDDYAQIASSGFKANDLVVEEGTNAQDKTRPNTIICKTTETLKELLKLYAMNPLNKVATDVVAK